MASSMDGLDNVLRNLKDLPIKVRRNAVRRATGKGASIIRRKARQNALLVDDPDTGRRIADNIGQRFRSKYFRQTGDTMISIGVLTTRGRIPRGNPDSGRRGNTPHWHLVELGTERAKAQPFLRPAAQSSGAEVLNAIAKELDLRVSLEVFRMRNK